MNNKRISRHWKTQKLAEDCVTRECPGYDPYKDFILDPAGHYVLIKVDFEFLRIELAVCDKDHNIIQIFRGQKCQDIYHAIFEHEKEHGVEWFKEKTHIAYLGKELKKAELALVMGQSGYYQE